MHASSSDRNGSIRCIMDILDHVELLMGIESDAVTSNAYVLQRELNEVVECLRISKINCFDAWILTEAKMNSFIEDSLEPWIREKYGSSFSFSNSRLGIGKA